MTFAAGDPTENTGLLRKAGKWCLVTRRGLLGESSIVPGPAALQGTGGKPTRNIRALNPRARIYEQ